MFPYKIHNVEEYVNKELMHYFQGEKNGFCQVGPKKWLLPLDYAKLAEGFYSMPVREDDVWVVTYPRSGTTVCQELIWQVNNNFDFGISSEVSLESRFPFYEFCCLYNEGFCEEIIEMNNNDSYVIKTLESWCTPGYITASNMTSPRHIKTHLPFSLLPPAMVKTSKVIYVARHPKDVAVSYFHHNRLLRVHGYTGDFERYWDYFQRDLLVFSPFWEHLMEGWERRHEPNVLFIFYEEIMQDLKASIEKIAHFLNKPVTTKQVEMLKEHLQIDNFRKKVKLDAEINIKGIHKTDEQSFIRKGAVGGNKEIDAALSEKIDTWIEEHLSKTDLKFPAFN